MLPSFAESEPGAPSLRPIIGSHARDIFHPRVLGRDVPQVRHIETHHADILRLADSGCIPKHDMPDDGQLLADVLDLAGEDHQRIRRAAIRGRLSVFQANCLAERSFEAATAPDIAQNFAHRPVYDEPDAERLSSVEPSFQERQNARPAADGRCGADTVETMDSFIELPCHCRFPSSHNIGVIAEYRLDVAPLDGAVAATWKRGVCERNSFSLAEATDVMNNLVHIAGCIEVSRTIALDKRAARELTNDAKSSIFGLPFDFSADTSGPEDKHFGFRGHVSALSVG